MHLLFLISSLEFGGAQKIAVGLAEEAVNRNHDASIVAVCPGNDFSERLARKGVGFHTLGYRGSFKPWKALSLLRLRRDLVSLIADLDPDIIHEQLFIPKILLYGRREIAGKPIVQTQQDNSPWWTRDDLYSKLQTHIERRFARGTARLTATISRSVQTDTVRFLGIPKSKCPMVYNFVDEPPKAAISDRRKNGSSKLFVLSRLSMQKKGLDRVVQIVDEVRKELSEVKLIVVGDGPDREKMQSMVHARALDEIVEFRGYRSDVYEQLREADVLLMPSRWEGFGITAAEAAAVGVPVVASRVGGLKEVVQHGQTGFTCEPGDIQSFIEHIERLLTDDDLYERISAKAVDRAKKLFSREKAFQAYEELYNKAISSN